MERLRVFLFVTAQIWMSTATETLYVLPDNSNNTSCPSQPCATLSQYLLDNGTLPVISDVQYHLLPGEHHIPVNMVLQNLYNFSIVGTVSNSSSPSTILVGCSQEYVINIINSYYVNIENAIFKRCYQQQLTNLKINWCYSCTIQNVVFTDFGLTGTNLIGNSHLSEITIRSDKTKQIFCPGISLTYSEEWSQNHLVIINRINISDEGKKCYIDYSGLQ